MEGPLAGLHELLIHTLKFVLLIFPPDKGLHRPDGGQALLDHIVEPVHRLLQPAIHGSHPADHQEENEGQDGGAHHKDEGQLGVHPEGETQSHDQHHRTSDQRAQSPVDGVLQHRYIGGHAGHQGARLKPVQVRKGIALDLFILGLPDPSAPTIGCPGGKPGVEQPRNKGQQGTQPHLKPLAHNVMEVPMLHPHIDEVGHEHRDHQLKDRLHKDQQAANEHIPPVGSQVGQQPSELPHGRSSLPVFKLR